MLIGRMLAGYGELELNLGMCLMAALNDDMDVSLKAMFSNRGEDAAHRHCGWIVEEILSHPKARHAVCMAAVVQCDIA